MQEADEKRRYELEKMHYPDQLSPEDQKRFEPKPIKLESEDDDSDEVDEFWNDMGSKNQNLKQ